MNKTFFDQHFPKPEDRFLTRRQFLQRTGMGFGTLGLATLLSNDFSNTASAAEAIANLTPRKPHFPAKAKHVIHIFAQGAPSHIDTWDPKPALTTYHGKPLPGLEGVAMESPFKFEKKGKAGIEVSEVFPKVGECVDDL